ncbi:neuropeptide Y receptor type 1-like isoform X1 [Montipora capricornis]|uniref:neuropeptide Y receptor type 1-like isoform X1 n=1 Tax=Montipora capricornis TaxID=246305 RepID=UPI0035F1F8B2
MSENSTAASPTNNSSNATTIIGCSAHSEPEKAFQVTAYCIIILVSVIGNVLIIFVFSKHKPLRVSINYFVVNMAFSDLFSPFTVMPVQIASILKGSDAFLVDSPLALGNALCKLIYFLPDVSVYVSIQSLLLLSIDRFIAVVFPLKAKLISSKMRIGGIVCTWIVAISVHAPYFYTLRLVYDETSQSHTCKHDWGFNHNSTHSSFLTGMFITFFLVPVCILAIAYSTIAWTIKRRHHQAKKLSTNSSGRSYQKTRQVIGLSLAILAAFIICIGPMLVLMFVIIFVWNWKMPSTCAFRNVVFVAHFLLHSWPAINPCSCFAFGKKYQNALRHTLKGLFRNDTFNLSTQTRMTSAGRDARSLNSLRVTFSEIIENGKQEQKEPEKEDEQAHK